MPATNCDDNLQAQLGDFIDRGEHIEGQQPFTVIDVEKVLDGQPGPGGAVTDVVFVVGPTASRPLESSTRNGEVVEELAGSTTNTRVLFTLVAWKDPALAVASRHDRDPGET